MSPTVIYWRILRTRSPCRAKRASMDCVNLPHEHLSKIMKSISSSAKSMDSWSSSRAMSTIAWSVELVQVVQHRQRTCPLLPQPGQLQFEVSVHFEVALHQAAAAWHRNERVPRSEDTDHTRRWRFRSRRRTVGWCGLVPDDDVRTPASLWTDSHLQSYRTKLARWLLVTS